MKTRLFILLFTLIFSGILWQANLFACNKKCLKAVKRYETKVVRAEKKNCNPNRGKAAKVFKRACSKEINTLDKRYDKFVKKFGKVNRVEALRKRQLKFNQYIANADRQAGNAKIFTPYRRKISSMEHGDCNVKIPALHPKCLKQLREAEKLFNKIPKDKHGDPVLVKLQKRYQKLIQTHKQMLVNADLGRQERSKILVEQRIKKLMKKIDYFQAKNSISRDNLNMFLLDYKAFEHRLVGTLDTSIIQGVPSYGKIKVMKNKFDSLLKTAISRNHWGERQLVTVSSPFKKLAKKTLQTNGWKLKNLGISANASWMIKKNSLGIPLEKSIRGWLFLRKPGESFCRIQTARFFRIYEGSSYQEASNIKVGGMIIPSSCN